MRPVCFLADAPGCSQTDEQYMVVTVRLPARVLQMLMDIDPNLERAITRVCEDCGEQLQKMSAAKG